MKMNNILRAALALFLVLPLVGIAMEGEKNKRELSDRTAQHWAKEVEQEREFIKKMTTEQEANCQERVQHFRVDIAETLIAQENAKERFVDDMAACLDEKEVKKSLKKKK